VGNARNRAANVISGQNLLFSHRATSYVSYQLSVVSRQMSFLKERLFGAK
jgi:hypothetical protein